MTVFTVPEAATLDEALLRATRAAALVEEAVQGVVDAELSVCKARSVESFARGQYAQAMDAVYEFLPKVPQTPPRS